MKESIEPSSSSSVSIMDESNGSDADSNYTDPKKNSHHHTQRDNNSE